MKRVSAQDLRLGNLEALKRKGEFQQGNTRLTGEYHAHDGALVLYSYGMPMMWVFDDGLTLSNPNPYSVTTTRHLGKVRSFEREFEMLVPSTNGLLVLSHDDESVVREALTSPEKSQLVNKTPARHGPIPTLCKRLDDIVRGSLSRYGVCAPIMQLQAMNVAGELLVPEDDDGDVVQLVCGKHYTFGYHWEGRFLNARGLHLSDVAFGALLASQDLLEVFGRLHGRSPSRMSRTRALQYERAFRDLPTLLQMGARASEAKAMIRAVL